MQHLSKRKQFGAPIDNFNRSCVDGARPGALGHLEWSRIHRSANVLESSTPSEDGIRQRSWPIDTHIALDQTRTNLVVAMHPRCPCSRASLAALEEIVARCPDAVSVTVLFYKPHAESADWTRTDLWKSAAAVPEIHVQVDEDGVEARHFGATTSGHAALYDQCGKMIFSGGITAARGHQGDSVGRSAIIALLSGKRQKSIECDVFGCPLFAAHETARESTR